MTPRIPDGYVAHWAYPPPPDDDGARWLAYLFERRYAQLGRVVSVLGGVVLLLGGLLIHTSSGRLSTAVALVGLLVAITGPSLQLWGGRAGYYELGEDGSVGARLGRARTDLTGRERVRVHDNVIDAGQAG